MSLVIHKSSKSVLIQKRRIKLYLCGFKIQREAFHGLNQRDFGKYIDHLSKYLDFLSLKLNLFNCFLICGIKIAKHDSKTDFNNKILEIITNNKDLLPPGLQLTPITGYDLHILEFSAIKIKKSNYIFDKANDKFYHYMAFSKLNIRSNSAKFLQSMIEKKEFSFIMTIDNTNGSSKFHILLEISDSNYVKIEELSNYIITTLKQTPNVEGQIVIVLLKNWMAKLVKLSLGFHDFNLKKGTILQIFTQIPASIKIKPNLTQNEVYPSISKVRNRNLIQTKNISPSNLTINKTNYTKNYEKLIDKLKENYWEIIEENSLASDFTSIKIKNEEINLTVFYVEKLKEIHIQQISQICNGHTINPIIFYSYKENTGDIADHNLKIIQLANITN